MGSIYVTPIQAFAAFGVMCSRTVVAMTCAELRAERDVSGGYKVPVLTTIGSDVITGLFFPALVAESLVLPR